MFGKNKYGLKSWIVDFYPVASELMKPLLDTLKLRSWYYELNQDSDDPTVYLLPSEKLSPLINELLKVWLENKKREKINNG
jgi:hypothetical protein